MTSSSLTMESVARECPSPRFQSSPRQGIDRFHPTTRPRDFFLWPRIFNFFNIGVSDVNTMCSDVTCRPRPSTCG